MAKNQEFDATLKELASLVGNAWDAAGGFDKELRRLLQQFQPEEVLEVVRGLAERGESLLVDPPAYSIPSPPPPRSQDYAASDDYEQRCLESALAAIPVADLSYGDWIKVGMALKSAGQDVYVWDYWSQADTRYKPGVCEQKWRGFTRDGVSVGSIYAMAQERGWMQPPRPRPQYQEPQAPWPEDADAPGTYSSGCAEAAVMDTPSVRPPDFSDSGNAEVFCRLYNHKLLYCDSLGWLHWDGKKWDANDHAALAATKELSNMMLRDAMAERRKAEAELQEERDLADLNGGSQRNDDAKKKLKIAEAYVAHAKKFRSATAQKNCLTLAVPEFVVPADTLDANGWLLNCPDGVIDLHTGEMRPHDPGLRLTKMARFSPGGKGAAKWKNFLDQTAGNDLGLVSYHQQIAGMAAVGEVYEEVLIVAYGAGRNGKSTLYNTESFVLGDYAGNIDPNVIISDKGNPANQMAELRGKRMVIAAELEEGVRLSTSVLKKLTSTDMMVVEQKFKQPEVVKPTHSTILFTNTLPKVGATDFGTWSRLKVVPFTQTIKAKDAIKNYARVLAEECGPAIMQWIVDGAKMFDRNGRKLKEPQAVEDASSQYQGREDQVGGFLLDATIRDPDGNTRPGILYGAYRRWCENNGEKYIRTNRQFNDELERRGFRRSKTHGNVFWRGLTLDEDGRIRKNAPIAEIIDEARYEPPPQREEIAGEQVEPFL